MVVTIKFLPFPILDIIKYNSNFYFFIIIKIKSLRNQFNFSSAKKLEILNNFIGYASSICIEQERLIFTESNEIKKEKYTVEIHKNTNNQIQYSVFHNDISIESYEDYNFKKNEETFSKEFIHLNNNKKNKKYVVKEKKDLNQLKHYGGFESFIPIFKILKYIISDLETIISNKNEKEKLDHYINESIE